jgi:hypothetical protein
MLAMAAPTCLIFYRKISTPVTEYRHRFEIEEWNKKHTLFNPTA